MIECRDGRMRVWSRVGRGATGREDCSRVVSRERVVSPGWKMGKRDVYAIRSVRSGVWPVLEELEGA